MTHEEAVRLGYPNVATALHMMRIEAQRQAREENARRYGEHQAELRKKLQGNNPGTVFNIVPSPDPNVARGALAERAINSGASPQTVERILNGGTPGAKSDCS